MDDKLTMFLLKYAIPLLILFSNNSFHDLQSKQLVQIIAKENVLSAGANRHLQKYLKLRGDNIASQCKGSQVGNSRGFVRCSCSVVVFSLHSSSTNNS